MNKAQNIAANAVGLGDWLDALADRWQDMADYLDEESKKGHDHEHRIAYAESKVYRHCAELIKIGASSEKLNHREGERTLKRSGD